jgi:hypothetical protein
MSVVKAPSLLQCASGLDAGTNLGRCHAVALAAQFLIRDRGNFDVQVDAVEQRTADFPEIALNNGSGAAAFPGRITEESTRASVQVATIPSMTVECRGSNNTSLLIAKSCGAYS